MNNKIKGTLLILWAGLLPYSLYLSSHSQDPLTHAMLLTYVCFPVFLFANDIIRAAYRCGKTSSNTHQHQTPKRRLKDRKSSAVKRVENTCIDTWV